MSEKLFIVKAASRVVKAIATELDSFAIFLEGGSATADAPKASKPRGGRVSSADPAPAAPAPAPAPTPEPQGNAPEAEKMTTETARPRILAVAQKVGSQPVKDLIKKETGCAQLADVPAEKLPALVKAIEAFGVAADAV